MSAEIIQARYDELNTLSRRFGQQAEATAQMQKRLERSMQSLQSGWQGKGSAAFFTEMNGKVLPVMRRLIAALAQAQKNTQEISQLVRNAEDEAGRLFKDRERKQVALGSQNGDGGGSFLGKAFGFVGDLFKGAGSELWDMAKGIGHLIRHPIDTAKGIWYGVTHPGELWDAFKKPFIDDWESGHPGTAIGRGLMFVGSLLLGTKGADKVLKAVRAGEVASTAGKAGELGKAGEVIGTAGKIGESGEIASGVAKTAEAVGSAGKVGRLIVPAGRTLSVSEQAIADLLVGEGRTVKALSESTVNGVRTADFMVDSVRTELKTIANIEGTTADKISASLGRRILDGAGQGKHIIADVRGQAGMSESIAERAIRRAYGAEIKNAGKMGVPPRIEQIRVIGNDFDVVVPFNP